MWFIIKVSRKVLVPLISARLVWAVNPGGLASLSAAVNMCVHYVGEIKVVLLGGIAVRFCTLIISYNAPKSIFD